MKYKALDTNIILADATNLLALGKDSTIILPTTVIHELDSKKSGFDEINFQAREFARIMSEAETVDKRRYDNMLVITLAVQGITVEVVSLNTYSAIDALTPANISNDQRIIETVDTYKNTRKVPVVFYSLDLMCRISADSIGIETDIPTIETEQEVPLSRGIQLDSSLFNSIDGKDINTIVSDHQLGTFSYTFESPDGNSTRGIVSNGKLRVYQDSDITKMRVPPLNINQKLWCKAIMSDEYDLQVLDAKAGTGKNLTSLSAAMRLIDTNPKYDKIIYVRNSIESVDKGADVGYLAGNEEKFRIYNMALSDTIEFIAKKSMKKASAESVESMISELISKYQIEPVWVGEMRGRTLSGAIVIMDEWQNSSPNTTQLVLSRLDNTCKAIVIGSNNQIDNPYLNKHNNGLTRLKADLTSTGLPKFSITLTKAVRGKFAEYAEELFA